MIRLYQLERCPWCAAARQGLANVGVEHELVNVPYERSERTDVIELTGQPLVPVLVDGDTVVWDSRRIVRYLYESYGGPERARSISELPTDTGGTRTLTPVIDECSVPDVR
jgi:glutathione S-transferase